MGIFLEGWISRGKTIFEGAKGLIVSTLASTL
jgi:hypothetical protein